jgi:alpha-galactosidase
MWALIFVLALAGAAAADPLAINSHHAVALAPPMGFNNWARFQCLPQAPLNGRPRAGYSFQDFMLDQGKALVETGLASAGYRTVVVDDCWMDRGADGELYGISHWGSYKHPSQQPGFDDDLTGYFAALHQLGLKGGLYNTSGKTTCQRVAAGEEGHQDQDAARFVTWGVDFLKLDNCGASDDDLPSLFKQMAQALGRATAQTDREILFDESAPAQYAPDDPMKYQSMDWVRPLGQMWRVAPDIRITHLGPDGRALYDPWSFNDAAQGYEEGVYQAYTDTVALSRYVAPGDWNDADQLLIGDSGLTTAEERSQMGLWSIMGAPLIISADIRALARNATDPHVPASVAILRNPRAIAIDQDPLGAGGYRVLRDSSADDTGVDIVLKPLADGGFAFLVLNKGPIAIAYALPLSKLGVQPSPCSIQLTDVWTGKVQTVDARGVVLAPIPSHDNAMFRVAPTACARLTATGQIAVAQAEFAQPPLCVESASEGAVTIQSCSRSDRQQWSLDANGDVRLAGTTICLSTTATGKGLMLASCDGAAAQSFRYHRSGAMIAQSGLCLGVDTAKVGAGGLLGQQGAEVKLKPCRSFAPDQTFSAPHLRPPPS